MSDDSANAMSSEEVREAVERLGSAVVDIDGARLDALEQRILGRIGGDHEQRRVAVPLRRRLLLGSLAAACVVVLVLVVSVLVGSNDAVVIAASEGVVVVRPDGSKIDGRVGLELPDGSRLEVTGFIEVSDERFGPGTYEVRDGRVVPADDSDAPESTPPERDDDTAPPTDIDVVEEPSRSTAASSLPIPTTVPSAEPNRPTDTRAPAGTEPVPTRVPTRPPAEPPTRPTTTVDSVDAIPAPTRPAGSAAPVPTNDEPDRSTTGSTSPPERPARSTTTTSTTTTSTTPTSTTSTTMPRRDR